MQEFDIVLRTFREIQEFISLATVQPFSVLVGNDNRQVNGKSFLGMVTLDHTRPLRVRANCDSQTFQGFRRIVSKFLTE